MRVGVQMIFQSWGYGDITDGQVVAEEVALGVLADQRRGGAAGRAGGCRQRVTRARSATIGRCVLSDRR